MPSLSKSKKLRLRKAHAARVKSHLETASIEQPTEACTSLKCYNVTNESIFVEGLKRAGLKVVPQPFSTENDSNQVVIVVQSQMDAYQIMRAIHGCELEGQTVHINIIDIGKRAGNLNGKVPKVKNIRSCVLDAFREKDALTRETEFSAAWQEVCSNIKAKKATEGQKVDKDLMKVQQEAVAMEMSIPGNDESKTLGEEIQGEKDREERGEMRDDSLKPESSVRQQMEVGETQNDLQGDTAHVIIANRSPTPDDFLSALYASLG